MTGTRVNHRANGGAMNNRQEPLGKLQWDTDLVKWNSTRIFNPSKLATWSLDDPIRLLGAALIHGMAAATMPAKGIYFCDKAALIKGTYCLPNWPGTWVMFKAYSGLCINRSDKLPIHS